MRRKTSRLSAFVLTLVLATAFAAPALAADRGGAARDVPIIRVFKQLLKRFGIVATGDELITPRP